MKKSGKISGKANAGLIHPIQTLTGTALFFALLLYLVYHLSDLICFVDRIPHTLLNLYTTLGNSLPSFAPALSFMLITAGLIAFKKVNLSLPAYSGF
jgi:hypothetical protein